MARRVTLESLLVLLALCSPLDAQAVPDRSALERETLERETLEHFQALLRLDTSNPPGNETRAVEYLRGVLEAEGIPTQTFARDPARTSWRDSTATARRRLCC